MKLTAAAPLIAVFLLPLGCGDDDQSAPADKPPVTTGDAAAPAKGDAGIPGTPVVPGIDGGSQPPVEARGDAQTTADGSTESVVDPAADAASPGDGSTVIDAGAAVDAGPTVDAGPGWILEQTCGPSSEPTMPCYVCEDENCCETYARYAANPEARAFRECMNACDGPVANKSCPEQCHAAHPTGTEDFAARFACLGQFCSECAGAPPDPCTSCASQYCAKELIGQVATQNGYLAQGCNSLCGEGNTDCAQRCYDEYGVSTEQVVSLGDCLSTNCKVCGAP